jgi:anti-sigma factor RsiW
MESRDHTTFSEWLSQEADGSLAPAEAAELATHLEHCAECQQERAQFAALERLFADTHVTVRRDFGARVMASLPPAGWESRHARGWAIPALLVAALGVLASFLLGHGPVGASSAAVAVAEMLGAALTAGAGLLHASWKGIGMVVQQGLNSWLNLTVFGILVLSLNFLLVSLVRRRSASTATVAARGNRAR